MSDTLEWHRVADVDELPQGRVTTVTAGVHTMALTHIDGEYTAMDNRCPHQGGPLGEGSIETGAEGECWLRCPWHGWDFDPKTGMPPGGHKDSGQKLFPVEVRDNGIYVGLEPEPVRTATVTDLMAETMTNWGVDTVFGIVGHSNLGVADALRLQEDLPNHLNLLLAYSREGRIADAILTVEKALALARAEGNTHLANRLEVALMQLRAQSH